MVVPIFKGDGVIAYENRDNPILDEHNNVLVELIACGICGTDMNILSVPPRHKAKKNIIIGHEGMGTVTQLFKSLDTTLTVGDRVVIAPRILCGKCKYCRMGIGNQCINYCTVGTTRDGTLAPFISIPDSTLYKIPNDVSIDDAVFFEPLSCVVGATSRVSFSAGNTVAIIGAGPMGALFAMLYQTMGAGKIIMIDVSNLRLDFCKTLGVHSTINIKDMNDKDMQECMQSMEADIVVDAVGNQMALCVDALRRGGHGILFGLKSGCNVPVEQYKITRNDITLHGAFVGLNPFVDTIALLKSGIMHPSKLISHRFPLNELMKGIDIMQNASGMKVVIDINNKSKD